MTTKDGGPAFPRAASPNLGAGGNMGHDGMSLRDWFAGQALAGLMATDSIASAPSVSKIGLYRFAAEASYGIADAMIEARTK